MTDEVGIGPDGVSLRTHDGVEHDDCDIIVMQRIMNDYGPEVVECGKASGQLMVNDIDDWFWGIHPDNFARDKVDPKLNPQVNTDHYRKTILASDVVTCSTPALAERLSSWGANAVVVRNAIDLERYTPTEQALRPIYGWVGSTSHRSRDLETLQGVMGPFLDAHDLNFHHSGWWPGFPHAAELLDVDLSRSTTSQVCKIEEYPGQFDPIDVGIVPLNDIFFNECKSAIKGMEYAAAGVPFIAQDIAEYRWAYDTHNLGIVAKRPKHWLKSLERLVDLDERKNEIEKNYKAVSNLDISKKWVDWKEAYGI